MSKSRPRWEGPLYCAMCGARYPGGIHREDCPYAEDNNTRIEQQTVHVCLGCGKIVGDRDGWEAHIQRVSGSEEHPDDFMWGLVEVEPVVDRDAIRREAYLEKRET